MKRDLFRELIVSSFFSLIILYFLPCPTKLFLQNSCEKSNNKMKESINIGIILKGVGRGSTKSFKLLRQFVTLYRSILKHSKEDQPLNFVFITGMDILTYFYFQLSKLYISKIRIWVEVCYLPTFFHLLYTMFDFVNFEITVNNFDHQSRTVDYSQSH